MLQILTKLERKEVLPQVHLMDVFKVPMMQPTGVIRVCAYVNKQQINEVGKKRQLSQADQAGSSQGQHY